MTDEGHTDSPSSMPPWPTEKGWWPGKWC